MLLLLSEEGEVYVAFGVSLEVLQQTGGVGCSRVEVVVELWVVEQQTDGIIAAIQLVGQALYVG